MKRKHVVIFRRAFAVPLSIAALLSTTIGAVAQETHYVDVQAGTWYEGAAAALLESGALDRNESRLRPNDLATRAEVMKLLVRVYGEELVFPAEPSFDDVPRSAWYYPYVETAARAGWVRGDNDCYQRSRPCTARPPDGVNRAEMAALLQRAFVLQYQDIAPVFPDNRRTAWYFIPIQTAADHCILQGDDFTGNVRPAARMNRAEMVVMFHRASQDLQYGEDCGVSEPSANILDATASSAQRVRVRFNIDVDAQWADDAFRYTVQRVGGGTIDVVDAIRVDARTVDLELGASLTANVSYRVTARDLKTTAGQLFTDTAIFELSEIAGQIDDVSVTSPDTVRVRFNVNVDATRADDAFRYTIDPISGTETIRVDRVSIVDARTVDVELNRAMTAQARYVLTVSGMRTSAGVEFTDTASFTMTEPTADLTDVTAISATRLRLRFNVALNESRAEEINRYRLVADNRDIALGFATLTDDTTVELVLNESLENQRSYTLTVSNLRTAGGITFSDSATFLYFPSDVRLRATLTGLQEVPPVITAATGTGTFTLTSAGLQYDITLSNMSGSQISGAHFHRAPIASEGPILEAITFTNLRATGTWTDLSQQERDDILSGRVYVNVHTSTYTDGEIRGQVVKE